MARPLGQVSTALGVAIRSRRGGEDQGEAAAKSGIARTTLSRLERGTHAPSTTTALALARWLGWTVEQVLEAAAEPAESP